MKITPTQQKFITLRADGMSYDKIAMALKVSKTTLIKWSKEHEAQIKELQFLAMETIKRNFNRSIQSRYETLLTHIQKIDSAITSADLSKAPIKDLITIQSHFLEQIEKLEKSMSINSGVVIVDYLDRETIIKTDLSEA